VGRSRFEGLLLLAAWAAGALAVAEWTWQVEPSTGPLATAWLVTLLAGAFAAIRWFRTPAGVLAWDGQQWSWTVSERLLQTHPQVLADLQHALLLRLGGHRGAAWLWLDRKSAPAHWHDLRRAVYSRARPEGLPGAQPPGSTR